MEYNKGAAMITLFEDHRSNFYPFTLSRTIANMYYGLFNNIERVEIFSAKTKKEDLDIEINSRFMGFGALKYIFDLKKDSKLIDINGDCVARRGAGTRKTKIEKKLLFSFSYDMMAENGVFIRDDIRETKGDEKLIVDKSAVIEDFVYLDTKNGPIFIDKEAKIHAGSRIEGPCYIGKKTKIFTAKIRKNTSIFTDCRIGGEVEQSIFYPYSNKYHEGFVGHSIFGSFTNLGALTTTSDLKNNYGNIRIFLQGKAVDTDIMKLGTLCGDHTKLGIGTLINSGTVIGFSSNLFGGGFFKKEYPSFYWGRADKGTTYDIEKAIETAKISMKRRGINFSKDENWGRWLV